eukprot:846067-Rhodomonas_salina.1
MSLSFPHRVHDLTHPRRLLQRVLPRSEPPPHPLTRDPFPTPFSLSLSPHIQHKLVERACKPLKPSALLHLSNAGGLFTFGEGWRIGGRRASGHDDCEEDEDGVRFTFEAREERNSGSRRSGRMRHWVAAEVRCSRSQRESSSSEERFEAGDDDGIRAVWARAMDGAPTWRASILKPWHSGPPCLLPGACRSIPLLCSPIPLLISPSFPSSLFRPPSTDSALSNSSIRPRPSNAAFTHTQNHSPKCSRLLRRCTIPSAFSRSRFAPRTLSASPSHAITKPTLSALASASHRARLRSDPARALPAIASHARSMHRRAFR